MTASLPPNRQRHHDGIDPDVSDFLAQLLSTTNLDGSNPHANGTPFQNRVKRGGHPSPRGSPHQNRPNNVGGRAFPSNGLRPAFHRSPGEKQYYSFPQGDDDVARWQFWPRSMSLGSLTGREFTKVSLSLQVSLV